MGVRLAATFGLALAAALELRSSVLAWLHVIAWLVVISHYEQRRESSAAAARQRAALDGRAAADRDHRAAGRDERMFLQHAVEVCSGWKERGGRPDRTGRGT